MNSKQRHFLEELASVLRRHKGVIGFAADGDGERLAIQMIDQNASDPWDTIDVFSTAEAEINHYMIEERIDND